MRPRTEPRGPVWGAESEELNATKLAWPAGAGVVEHAADRDVVYVVLVGSLVLSVDGRERDLAAGDVEIVAAGARRSIVAGSNGVEYVTKHWSAM